MGLNINIASLIGYSIGLLNSFFLSQIWVFKQKSFFRWDKSLILFAIIYMIGGLEMTIIINLGIKVLNNYRIAWFIGALFAASNNYLASKYFLFSKK